MKPGAGQGSPLQGGPTHALYRAILVKIITSPGAGVGRQGGRIIDFLFTVVSPAVLPTLGGHAIPGATDRREPAEAGQTGTSSSRGWRGSGY